MGRVLWEQRADHCLSLCLLLIYILLALIVATVDGTLSIRAEHRVCRGLSSILSMRPRQEGGQKEEEMRGGEEREKRKGKSGRERRERRGRTEGREGRRGERREGRGRGTANDAHSIPVWYSPSSTHSTGSAGQTVTTVAFRWWMVPRRWCVVPRPAVMAVGSTR